MSRDRYVLGPPRLLLLAGREVDVAIILGSVAKHVSSRTIARCLPVNYLAEPSISFSTPFLAQARSRNG